MRIKEPTPSKGPTVALWQVWPLNLQPAIHKHTLFEKKVKYRTLKGSFVPLRVLCKTQ